MLPGIEPRGTANWYGSPGGPFLTGLVDRLGGVWTRWDGQWYLQIATAGYRPGDVRNESADARPHGQRL